METRENQVGMFQNSQATLQISQVALESCKNDSFFFVKGKNLNNLVYNHPLPSPSHVKPTSKQDLSIHEKIISLNFFKLKSIM